MTIYETLCAERTKALKEGRAVRKSALNEMIDACQKAQINSIKNSAKPELTDEFCKPILQKYQKMVEEMVNTCPSSRAELLDNYRTQLAIVKEFVPQQITNPEEIKNFILSTGFALTDKKNLMPALKAYGADMRVAQAVIKEMGK